MQLQSECFWWLQADFQDEISNFIQILPGLFESSDIDINENENKTSKPQEVLATVSPQGTKHYKIGTPSA